MRFAPRVPGAGALALLVLLTGLAGCASTSSGGSAGGLPSSASSLSASPSASSPTSQPVLVGGSAASSTTVEVHPTQLTAGQSLDIKVKVRVYGTSATGSVVLTDSGSVLRTVALAWAGDAGSAEVTLLLPAGTHHLAARYGGDAHHSASASAVLTVAVARIAAQVSVSASLVPKTRAKVRVGVAVRTHRTTVAAAGYVVLVVGGFRYTLALDATGHAHINISIVPGVRYYATASYGGDVNVSPAGGSTSFVF